jgi:hypothetical protein
MIAGSLRTGLILFSVHPIDADGLVELGNATKIKADDFIAAVRVKVGDKRVTVEPSRVIVRVPKNMYLLIDDVDPYRISNTMASLVDMESALLQMRRR